MDQSMMTSEIFIVDDDRDICETLSEIFRGAGYCTAAFTDGLSFVRLARSRIPACVLLDICMPGASGLQILRELDARTYPAPILIVSGLDDVLSVVQAMRFGAFDYIEKRLAGDAIVARVIDAMDTWTNLRQRGKSLPFSFSEFPGYHDLTRRERHVLSNIAAAATNKETAINLGISTRTVEIHRSRIMHKLGARNSVDLMRIVMNNSHPVTEVAVPMQSRHSWPSPPAPPATILQQKSQAL
jgi:two-component system, LuxR family, response regulator FixJ